MAIIFWVLISTFLVSLISFIGILTLLLKEKLLNKILFSLISLSAGGLMGGAFLHLIPESLEEFARGPSSGTQKVFLYVLVGFFLFFLTEKILHWRHCHIEKCPVHTFAYMNLLGDSVHNFIDGLVIAASFSINISLGITTTLAIALHEIPQEIGDFGVLIYGGLKKTKAVFLNFLTALLAIGGGIFGYCLSVYTQSASLFLLPFAAGGFIYIAASDLIPEIRKDNNLKGSLLNFLIFLGGILIMYAMKFIAPE